MIGNADIAALEDGQDARRRRLLDGRRHRDRLDPGAVLPHQILGKPHSQAALVDRQPSLMQRG